MLSKLWQSRSWNRNRINLLGERFEYFYFMNSFWCHKATEATKATNNIWTMGHDIISTRTAQRWFNRFDNGNFVIGTIHLGVDCTGRKWIWYSTETALLKTILWLTYRLWFSRTTWSALIPRWNIYIMNELGKTWKYGSLSIPHELSAHQLSIPTWYLYGFIRHPIVTTNGFAISLLVDWKVDAIH